MPRVYRERLTKTSPMFTSVISQGYTHANYTFGAYPMNDSVHQLAPGSFVAAGLVHGRVEKVTDDGQVLITHYTPVRNGWEPSLKKSNYKINALTKIDDLKSPEAGTNRIRIVNRSSEHAEMIIYSDIGDDGWMGGLSAEEFSKQLSAIGDVKNLDIRLNSAGGSVFDGLTIYQRLKQHTAKVHVFVDGLAASIASIIAMAADEITVYNTSTVMIHKPWTFAGGSADDFASTIARLDAAEGQMVGIYADKTGLSADHIKRLLTAETWMTGEEALELGFADNFDESTSAMAAAVKPDFNKQWFAHAPKQTISNTELSETICRAKAQSVSLLSRSRSVA